MICLSTTRRRKNLGAALSIATLILYSIHEVGVYNTSQVNAIFGRELPSPSAEYREPNASRPRIEATTPPNHFGCPGVIRLNYCVIEDVIQAKNSTSLNTITLTTQGTVEFIHHVLVLCSRWQGPISVSVYAPGFDFESAYVAIEKFRICSECVHEWVTWHFIFDLSHQPQSLNPGTFEMIGRKEIVCSEPLAFEKWTYVSYKKLLYPINVARNVALLNARTKYVLASDIELYPSIQLIPSFLQFAYNRSNELPYRREVFVLPVFEVKKNVIPPVTKPDLVTMFNKHDVLPFHLNVCRMCHVIPNLTSWLLLKKNSTSALDIFSTLKRNKKNKLRLWEPFFISTKDFPMFDERLSWNGRANKMQVAREMCYLNYEFHILDQAFLVHSPGIKTRASIVGRKKYHKAQRKILTKIYADMESKYGSRRNEC